MNESSPRVLAPLALLSLMVATAACPSTSHAPPPPVDPLASARVTWTDKCASCHALDGHGGQKAPDLKGFGSRKWIRGFLADPQGKLYMGPAKLRKPMEPVEAAPEEFAALTEFIYAQSGATDVDASLAKNGEQLIPAMDCDSCHETDGIGQNTGPNLKGLGSRAWLAAVIGDASAGHLFGDRNKMKPFAGRLSPAEIDGLVNLIVDQKNR
jgi:cytochrome c553